MNKLALAGADIVNSVREFFITVFDEFAGLWFWPAIFLGIMVLAVIVMSFLVKFSYENRILKSINKLNNYFVAKPFITEENLVEFNLKMKKVPKVLRNNWQIYMLNREDGPSTYINTNTCIDKPLRTSSIEKNLGNFTIFSIFLGILSFVVGIMYARQNTAVTANRLETILFVALLIPLAISLIYTIFTLIIKATKNDMYACLYENFPLYERNLNKAVSTLPAYVDYEILFTRKEIKEGIPILQQYLEKRALIEQQELQQARENSEACEEYNFDELGMNGSLVLERAMKECETFIKVRRRLQEECAQIEAEKENYKKNFETTSKDLQRKLQASRENLESLKAQQEASTNRIESNYIRKQQGDEIKKQEQLEKDNEEATVKFNEEQVSLQQEIEKREQEIEEKKQFVEQAMLLEFKHYANGLYKALTQKAAEVGNQKLLMLSQENADLKTLLTDLQGAGATEPINPEGLIQTEELTAENLYDMSKSEEKELEKGRETSSKMAKEEDKKQEEHAKKQEELANQQQAEQQVEEQPAEQVEEPPAEQPTEPVVEQPAEEPANTEGDTENNGDDTANNAGDEGNATDDGGKQVEADEDMANIQKQIDEETTKLQQEKQELEKDLTNISNMEEAQTAEPVVEQPAPAPAPQPEPVAEQPQPEPVVEQPQPEPVAEQPAPAPAPQPEPAVEQPAPAPVAEEPAEEPAPAAAPRARRGRSVRATSSARTAKKANSELDALNAEMQKLLDSTKK